LLYPCERYALSKGTAACKLVAIQYERNDINFIRNKFRVRGDVVEIFPSGSSEMQYVLEYFGDEIERISEIQGVTGNVISTLSHAAIYPATHYVISKEVCLKRLPKLSRSLYERVKYLRKGYACRGTENCTAYHV
jgi:excinuclease ABC subunit B